MTEGLDLPAYLARIGYAGDVDPTIETLTALHRAHALSIPFENLDILLGRPIRLDLSEPPIEAGLRSARRLLLRAEHAVRGRPGASRFRGHLLAARVRMGDDRSTPRTHMTLAVDVGETRLLADVGFGGDTLLEPIAFDNEEPVRQGAWTFRLERRRQLSGSCGGSEPTSGLDLYAFTRSRSCLSTTRSATTSRRHGRVRRSSRRSSSNGRASKSGGCSSMTSSGSSARTERNAYGGLARRAAHDPRGQVRPGLPRRYPLPARLTSKAGLSAGK